MALTLFLLVPVVFLAVLVVLSANYFKNSSSLELPPEKIKGYQRTDGNKKSQDSDD
ncbi:MAG: hypothetical protein PHV17_05590 [Candidatus Omnitrophica bacterium]|nr:hypothetical protein [Candidatus Omnitrophota bacterium]